MRRGALGLPLLAALAGVSLLAIGAAQASGATKAALVKDIGRSGGSSYPAGLTNVNGTLFFVAGGLDRSELWKSDGTAKGTALVKDINRAGGSNPYDLTNFNGTLFFSADDGTDGR